ncbi:apicoplast integral membrane protein [Plasmodium yoelii yoelii]|uniref:Apicoplast integral membrane protein n=1 Tax=Plasmodium yoelii yoelii TaxID=73239 RepID=A0AAF0AZG9_PLAYO|nr:apicoplast integral membrane protein [Plasmodium yoelii yoelii]
MRAVFLFVIITIFIGDIIGEKYKNIKKYKIVRSYICNQYNSDNKFYTENGKKKILNKYRIKYNTKIKRLNVLLNIKEINLIKNVNFLSSINMVTSLSSIFIFMHILNYFKLINNTHRNALLEITDKICSKIFLFNTINDIINTNFQKNIPKYFIIGLFSITQFIFHTLFSNVMACLFYSRDQQNGEKIIEKKNITKCEDNNKENNYLLEKSLSKSNEVSNYIKTKNEDILNKNYHNGSLRNDINNSKQIETSEIERKNNMNNVSLLKHLCTLSHTGLIPIILSKIYVNYFIKNSNIENSGDSSSPDKKINKWCTPLALLNNFQKFAPLFTNSSNDPSEL